MKILIVIATLCITSCASITSFENKNSSHVHGLSYYMPKKDIVVKVTIEASNITKVALETTPSYPDLSKRYVLNHNKNIMGKNLSDISITESGLLTTVTSKTTSNVTDIFSNLATSYGNFTKPPLGSGLFPPIGCNTDTEHVFIYKSEGEYNPCGLSVTIKKEGPENKGVENTEEVEVSSSGIFYRQDEPYRVTINSGSTIGDLNFSSIVFSPSYSTTSFLPISKSFFANNSAEFTFEKGIPTKYKQDVDGEALAVAKIPSAIITSVFTAVGSVYSRSSTTNQNEISALEQTIKLEL